MEKITKEQFDSMPFISSPRNAELSRMIDTLAPNDALIIKKEEWKKRIAPVARLGAYRKGGKNFIGRTLADGSGWAILRIQ